MENQDFSAKAQWAELREKANAAHAAVAVVETRLKCRVGSDRNALYRALDRDGEYLSLMAEIEGLEWALDNLRDYVSEEDM